MIKFRREEDLLVESSKEQVWRVEQAINREAIVIGEKKCEIEAEPRHVALGERRKDCPGINFRIPRSQKCLLYFSRLIGFKLSIRI